MIAAGFRCPVRQADDGSEPRMHDLDIHLPNGHVAAVEVECGRPRVHRPVELVNDRDERWIVPDLLGGWMVTLEPDRSGQAVTSVAAVMSTAGRIT